MTVRPQSSTPSLGSRRENMVSPTAQPHHPGVCGPQRSSAVWAFRGSCVFARGLPERPVSFIGLGSTCRKAPLVQLYNVSASL